DGCDRFCTYCTIPYIRGRYRSFPLDDVRADVAAQVAAGVREIVLIAQDTGRWGADFDEPSSLAALVSTLAEEFPATWFRVMYIQPEGLTDELLDAVAAHDNVCDYFDIPLQHVDADILRVMNRTGSREEFLALVERVLAHVPGATLRTTLIAGFPGETDEQFEDLCAFVEEGLFDYVGVFPYSREEAPAPRACPIRLTKTRRTTERSGCATSRMPCAARASRRASGAPWTCSWRASRRTGSCSAAPCARRPKSTA
ncbi:radical SAM protein, partial [Eggerthella sinensis]|uniref:radical SAM protein n=1 Tax=Eggerthella sinensis TaxID=242230 RepID=UPI0022E29B49